MQWWQHLETFKANLLALGARRLSVLAAVVAITMSAIGGVGYYSTRTESEALYIGLTASDVSRMGSALQAAGIPFDVSSDGTKVLVRRTQAATARMILAEKGLPSGATAGYELFDKLGPLGLTSFMQEVTRTRALEGELARTIQTMKGVKSARVHIVYPEASAFRRNRQPASASVVVRMEGLREANAGLVIRHLVSAAVPGLAAEHVSVMSTDGAILVASGDASISGSSKLIDLERTVSGQLQENVRRTLARYLGVENFEVTVAARLNFDKRQHSEQVFDPESKAERSTRVIREAGSSSNTASRSGVTVEQNVPGEAAPQNNGDQARKSNERREELTNFEINSKTIAVSSEGHRVEAINVAVVLNKKRLLATLAGAKDEKALEQRIKELEALVGAAAGVSASRGDKVSIAAFDFADATGDGNGNWSLADGLLMHLDRAIISLTILAGIALFAWLGLVPAVRTIVSQVLAKDGEVTSAAGVPAVASGPAVQSLQPAEPAAPLSVPHVNQIQRKLAELIERDEKQVALILKQWLAKA